MLPVEHQYKDSKIDTLETRANRYNIVGRLNTGIIELLHFNQRV